MVTTILAIWGALLSSAMAGFELFRFTYRARLVGDVSDGMSLLYPGVPIDDVLHLLITVRNIGSQSTTIENVGVYGYKRVFAWKRPWVRRNRIRAGVLTVGNVPTVLMPGSKWGEHLPQQQIIDALADCDEVVFIISHSMSKSGLRIPHAFKKAATVKTLPGASA